MKSTLATLRLLALFCYVCATAAATVLAEQPSIAWNPESGRAVLTNGRMELVVETKSGLNPRSLRDVKTGQVYADRDYAWSLGNDAALPKVEGAPVVVDSKDGKRVLLRDISRRTDL
jgi:hypothetical protein